MARCEFQVTFRDIDGPADYLCPKDAVIRYDGMNRCIEHADPNVLRLY